MSFWAQFLPAACVHSDGKPVDGRETVYYSRGAYLGMASRCGRTMERRKAIYRRCVRWVLFLVAWASGYVRRPRAYAVPSEWLGPEPAPIYTRVRRATRT